jgi:alkanesulfonate monooxygenase
LLAFHADAPDCLQIGQQAASVTQRLNIFIAQRPGFAAPTLLARQFATLDHLFPRRI